MPDKKPEKKELSDEEVLKIFRQQAQKEVPQDENNTPALSNEALEAVLKNIQKKGQVWEDDEKKPQ